MPKRMPIDEETEGCIEFSQRLLDDPWSEPAARQAIGFAAAQKVGGGEIALTRVDLYPVEATGHSLAWLCFGGQEDIDNGASQTQTRNPFCVRSNAGSMGPIIH
jgi:hypothetical protein